MKSYYVFVDDKGCECKSFKRSAYAMKQGAYTRMLIHYKGDASVASKSKPYIRTCPSVSRALETSTGSPSVIYKKKIASASESSLEYHPICFPRNKKQVANMQSIHRQKIRISHDALYNLHELSYDIQNFVHKIVTFPNIVVVCGLKHILKEANQLFQIHDDTVNQMLSYDTTFQLGDFYVSCLLFKNVLFEKTPTMPLLFMFHEKKLKDNHDELMKVAAIEIPYLAKGKRAVPLVTDDEKGFTKAIETNLTNVCRFYCWNHTIKAPKTWLKGHGASAGEIPVYMLSSRTFLKRKTVRSQAFFTYYKEELHEKVCINSN